MYAYVMLFSFPSLSSNSGTTFLHLFIYTTQSNSQRVAAAVLCFLLSNVCGINRYLKLIYIVRTVVDTISAAHGAEWEQLRGHSRVLQSAVLLAVMVVMTRHELRVLDLNNAFKILQNDK